MIPVLDDAKHYWVGEDADLGFGEGKLLYRLVRERWVDRSASTRRRPRSVLPTFLTCTTWAIGGVSQREILKRTRSASAAGKVLAPETGSLTFMMSKNGYLRDGPHGPWHPHLMFCMPPMRTADWGADLPGTRVFGAEAGVDPWTLFFVPVAAWSDGTPDEPAGARQTM